ncbi:MAG TPA: prolyl oligopeptidase family serine peptidase, partial [Gemmatimonadaceae bacterium]|nr:prolyl oligopeptidase family serine peptidase [Gemmatimonadaceae bacterium]
AATAPAQGPPARVHYPETRTVDTVTNYFGTRVPDPYRWLEAIDGADVAAWVKTENAVTMPYLAALPGRDLLAQRITALYDYPRTSVPFWEGGRWFYTRNAGLQRQSVWFARETLDGPERLILDPNALSPDGSVALSGFSPSPDGEHLAYGQSEGGSDWVTWYVRDLATGRNTADTVRWSKFSGASWTRDGRGFFYSRFPEPPAGKQLEVKLEHQTLYYHRLGTPQSADVKIYARPDHPSWFVFGGTDETGRYLFVTTSPGTDKNELYIADLGDPLHPNVGAPIRPVVTGQDANYSPLGVADGRLYLQVDRDAPNRKIVAAPVATPDPAHWATVIPEGDMPIEGASLVAGRLGVLSLQDVASVVRLYRLDGTLEREVPLPGLGSASGLVGRFDRPELFYSFTSPLQPSTAFLYDAATNTSRPFNAPKLTFDPSRFETERVFYQSKDGTRVPMFLTHRRDLPKNGQNPTMLYAYGGFSISSRPSFSPAVIAWIEQGGVYALANIRGGGEYGERWHQAGQFERKQNVFDDFVAAAEWLVRERYTSPEHLAINGGSNGGLLVGAAMTQRPDLFAVAVPQVGVMDMLRYDRFTGGAAWATEYGSSSDSTAFRYLRAYSPLHNIRSGVCYPATLITTADHDDRVVPSHSFKFAATMQTEQAQVAGCTNPVLIRIEAQGSHGYRPLDRRIMELADIWAFTAYHTGMRVRRREAVVP